MTKKIGVFLMPCSVYILLLGNSVYFVYMQVVWTFWSCFCDNDYFVYARNTIFL